MNDERDAAAVRIPPPLVYLSAVVAGALLHGFAWQLPLEVPLWIRVALALTLAIPSIVLLVGALRIFRRTGQDPEPWKPTPEIVSTGVYRYTRNPMYVGLALFQSALGIALGNVWILALAPVALGIVYVTAVRHEEIYLARKFGDEYLAYKAKVGRWL